MRARLADARFFFEEDKKTPLAARVDKLAGIVFHARLGTVRDKVARIEALADHLAKSIGLADADRQLVQRAAHLCKTDLVSLMVGEFPELQGIMGRAYAIASGEPARVADAIRDHYRPIGADGAVAEDDVACLVGLADRFDTLAGAFAVGLQPTGTADPFALRRACIGILRTLTEHAPATYSKIHFGNTVRFAYGLFADKKLDKSGDETALALADFATERLRGLLETQAGKASASAVLGGVGWIAGERVAPIHHPAFALAKAKALQAAVDEKAAWLDTARTVAKRLSGISKEAKPELVARASFVKPTDAAIVDLVHELDRKTAALETEHAVRDALFTTATLAAQLDKIFVETLVNDPSDAKTPDRLRLLSYGASCMLRLADFSRLG
jgi:glycyl-tRNA synthetase beta chain